MTPSLPSTQTPRGAGDAVEVGRMEGQSGGERGSGERAAQVLVRLRALWTKASFCGKDSGNTVGVPS